jgi:hypothetical protein
MIDLEKLELFQGIRKKSGSSPESDLPNLGNDPAGMLPKL